MLPSVFLEVFIKEVGAILTDNMCFKPLEITEIKWVRKQITASFLA